EPPPPIVHRARWPALAGVGVGVVGLGLGAVYHARAIDSKNKADDLTAGSTAFEDERDRFGTLRAVAISGYAVGAAALGFAAVWWFTDRGHPATRPMVGVSVGNGGATFTLQGALP
ncbi:MAG TPA: hypothetical protein VHE35_36385, partial [Kofleriaceae bacterium]|nr:hypothetical protein [Kofleriaceae bacterium]